MLKPIKLPNISIYFCRFSCFFRSSTAVSFYIKRRALFCSYLLSSYAYVSSHYFLPFFIHSAFYICFIILIFFFVSLFRITRISNSIDFQVIIVKLHQKFVIIFYFMIVSYIFFLLCAVISFW